ncbi:MAG: tRNA pseudouridine(55) synthase TruB, partial [Phycisphaerales bacterium]|nr:tRNA pseudouridine(55) synthase TruB [Phycisphaerales bacterium]
LGLGRGTKSLSALMDTEKEYETEIDLGAFTATDDREGEREPVAVERPPTPEAIETAVGRFRGPIMQQPPAYSAVKVDGRRAYKIARRGGTPELVARPVVVHALEVRDYAWPRLTLRVRCGKGLYVRRLARDLGAELGTGGYCLSIRRTAVGPFTLEEAIPLDAVPDPLTENDLVPLDAALARLA